MQAAEIFYELIKQLNLSLDNNEKDKDIEKIKDWISYKFNKDFLVEVCTELQKVQYTVRDTDWNQILVVNNVRIDPEKYIVINQEAMEQSNYITIDYGHIYYYGKEGKSEIETVDKRVADCLDKLLGEDKAIYFYDNKYYMDIRKLERNQREGLFYSEGTRANAEKIFDDLNGFIKDIFIKDKIEYKKAVKIDAYMEISRLLCDAIPVFDESGKIKKIGKYIEQRNRIKKRIQKVCRENREKYASIIKNEKFETLLGIMPKRERLEENLLILEKIEEEAAVFLRQKIVELVFEDLQIVDEICSSFCKEIVRTRWQKNILGKYEYDQLKLNFEEIIAWYKDILDEKDWQEFSCMISNKVELKNIFSNRLEENDYIDCYDKACGEIMK